MGSASVAIKKYVQDYGVYNPNAQIIRSLFESGIVGTVIFIMAFTQPLRSLYIPRQKIKYVMLYMFFILGAYFGHRSGAPYIFLGITILIYTYKQHVQKNEELN